MKTEIEMSNNTCSKFTNPKYCVSQYSVSDAKTWGIISCCCRGGD